MAKIEPKISVSSLIRRTHTAELSAEQIGELFATNQRKELPANARIFFRVPRGGDYSGDEIEISAESPLYIEWTETETSESEGSAP